MNFGYPLLSEDSSLQLEPNKTQIMNAAAIAEIKDFRKITGPQPGYEEQVFCHSLKADEKGETSVTLQNKKLGIALTIKFNINQLPYFIQWKMFGQGEYVLGLEPGNVPPKNRKDLSEKNILPYLQPGESITNVVEVILTDV